MHDPAIQTIQPPAGHVFFEHLSFHIAAGTRPGNARGILVDAWTYEELADAMDPNAQSRGTELKNINNWLNGEGCSDASRKLLEDIFFGDNKSYDQWRCDFRIAQRNSLRRRPRFDIPRNVGELKELLEHLSGKTVLVVSASIVFILGLASTLFLLMFEPTMLPQAAVRSPIELTRIIKSRHDPSKNPPLVTTPVSAQPAMLLKIKITPDFTIVFDEKRLSRDEAIKQLKQKDDPKGHIIVDSDDAVPFGVIRQLARDLESIGYSVQIGNN